MEMTHAAALMFLQAVKEWRQRLRKADTPDRALDVAASAHERMAVAAAEAPVEARNRVACRAGCSFCCHVPLGVQAHEVLVAARHIERNFTPEERAQAVERLSEHRRAVAGSTDTRAYHRPCALLVNDRCSIYAGRPEVCRAHYAYDVRGCMEAAASKCDDSDAHYAHEVRNRAYLAMVAIDQGAAEAGFDGKAYDFGSALHEALTVPGALGRWFARKQTFPDDCREPAPGPGQPRGEIRPGVIKALEKRR